MIMHSRHTINDQCRRLKRWVLTVLPKKIDTMPGGVIGTSGNAEGRLVNSLINWVQRETEIEPWKKVCALMQSTYT